MLRHSISFLVVLTIALFLSSCAGRHTAALLDDVETYIQERPDSALATIRAIDTTTLTSRSLRAHFALLHAMALDKNWIDTTDVNVVMPAVEYYDWHPSGIRRAKAWYYLGRIQQNGGDYPEASISLLKAEQYAKESDDSVFKTIVYLSISTIYNQTHLREEALRYSEMAYNLAQSAGDTVNINAARYAMAIDLFNLGRYAESDSLYQLLIDNNRLDSHLRPSLLCNYALNCMTQKEDYYQAVRIFEEVLASTGSLKKRNYWGAYAYALSRTGKTDRADRIFRQLGAKNGATSYEYSYWKSLTDAGSGDYQPAYELLKSADEIQRDNVTKVLRQSAIKAQKDYLEQVKQAFELSAKRRKWIARGSAIILLSIIAFIVWLFRRRSKHFSQEKEMMLETYKNLTMKHVVLTSQISELNAQVVQMEKEKEAVRNQYIQTCQSHFSQIGRINEIMTIQAQGDKSIYKKLKEAIQELGKDDAHQFEFEELLNKSLDNVMKRFRNEFPKKKPRYYQLVSYLFADFDTTTICTIIPGFKKHSVHVERSRLKQMIQDSNSSDKEFFLQILS